MEDITDRVCCVTEQVWRALHKRFGGGPAVTHLQPCGTCIQKAKLLEERRSAEREKYVEVSRLSIECDVTVLESYMKRLHHNVIHYLDNRDYICDETSSE